jgi:Spy/CpxP family protein refolding chaperone
MLRNFAIALLTMAALAWAANLQAQGPGGGRGRGMGRGMMGGGSLMLLQNEKVQKELDLDADQKEKIQALVKEQQEEFAANRESMRDLSPEERMTKMRESMEKTQKKVDGILLPKQAERVKQISLQMQLSTMPGMVLANPDVVKELGLTEDQQSKIKAVNEDARKSMSELFTPGEQPDREKMAKARKDTETKLMDVLTADQKDKLEKMKGEKFDTSGLRMGPGGPGGGRRGNRGGNGGGAGPVT